LDKKSSHFLAKHLCGQKVFFEKARKTLLFGVKKASFWVKKASLGEQKYSILGKKSFWDK